MKHLIKVTNDTITVANSHGINPVVLAVANALKINDVVVDRRYILLEGKRAFRSPVSVETFTYKHYTGQELEPFEFEL